MIENIFSGGQALLFLYPVLIQPAIQPFVSEVLKDGEIDGRCNAGSLCGAGQILVVRFDLVPEKKPFMILAQWRILLRFAIGDLLPATLDGKICLRKSNRRLP